MEPVAAATHQSVQLFLSRSRLLSRLELIASALLLPRRINSPSTNVLNLDIYKFVEMLAARANGSGSTDQRTADAGLGARLKDPSKQKGYYTFQDLPEEGMVDVL